MTIFRSAVTESNGVDINVGYLSLFMLMVAIIGTIPVMCIGAAVQMFLDPAHKFPLQELGAGVGLACTGFATALTALGVFVWGDRKNQTPPNTSNSTSTSTNVTTTNETIPPEKP